jgi:hypothetical protein
MKIRVFESFEWFTIEKQVNECLSEHQERGFHCTVTFNSMYDKFRNHVLYTCCVECRYMNGQKENSSIEHI